MKSFLKELREYVYSRLLLWRIALLWLVITTIGALVSESISIQDMALISWISALLISQFRLMDDLNDIPYDRKHAPDRVLVKSKLQSGYYFVIVVLFILTGVSLFIFRPLPQLATYLLLFFLAMSIYRISKWQGKWRLLRNQIILTKYPVFLFLCSVNVQSIHLVIAGAIFYIALSIEELLTDKTLKDIR